jgi:hypothetical protein
MTTLPINDNTLVTICYLLCDLLLTSNDNFEVIQKVGLVRLVACSDLMIQRSPL